MLHLLPTRTGGAAENMAADFLLLQRYPQEAHARLRHYDWRHPAFTFGVSQKIEFVRAQLPADDPVELCRRPTGGGVVDHRDDWTYALVVPRGHALYDARAVESYRIIHQDLADTLRDAGASAVLKKTCEADCEPEADSPRGPGVCFKKPELYDVLHPDTGAKIAGAAQKRTKHGMLFQGSLWRPALGPAGTAIDWDAFLVAFAVRLAATLRTEVEETPWPDFVEGELEDLTERYSTPEWIEHR